MIIVNVYVESGCEFDKGEYRLDLNGVVSDSLDLDCDPEKIKECIDEYDGIIAQEITYTFFLNRANISTAFPGYEPAFDIQQVIEDVHEINVKL